MNRAKRQFNIILMSLVLLFSFGITAFADIGDIMPKPKESEDERIRKQLIAVVELYYGETPEQEKKDCLAWLEKQSEEASNIALRTEYEKGRADAIAEMQKSESITDEWIEDYWQHKKVNNPYSYDKGEEIQFDYQGFVRFCKKYCKRPAWSEEDKSILDSIISDIQLRIEAVEDVVANRTVAIEAEVPILVAQLKVYTKEEVW